MDDQKGLYAFARMVVLEQDPDATAEILFQRILSIADADRGFIVVREGGSFTQKLDFRYDRAALTAQERRFSRTLVREVIERAAPLHWHEGSPPRGDQPPAVKSLFQIGSPATLVVPLIEPKAGDEPGEVMAVIYLDRARGRGDFPARAPALVTEIATMAAGLIRRALDRKALADRARSLENDLLSQHDFGGIITRDAAMLALLETVAQVADSTASVFIRGETGTGKELVARALHVNSPRKHKPLVTLHCTALPATLLESELFGHVRGAFTGADRDRTGRAASAHGGTLFLDEVAEIPPEAQAKLLRFLQFGEIQRLGSDRVEKVDVRVIAATHQNLEDRVATGAFREDLYYRLKVVEIELPPLRDRKGDLPLLLDAFLRRSARDPKSPPRLSPKAMQALTSYSFPGNIRELAHLAERVCVLARGPEILLSDLPKEIRSAAASPTESREPAPSTFAELSREALDLARDEATAAIERDFLTQLLAKHGGKVAVAAREARMHRSYLQKLLAKHRDALGREPPG